MIHVLYGKGRQRGAHYVDCVFSAAIKVHALVLRCTKAKPNGGGRITRRTVIPNTEGIAVHPLTPKSSMQQNKSQLQGWVIEIAKDGLPILALEANFDGPNIWLLAEIPSKQHRDPRIFKTKH